MTELHHITGPDPDKAETRDPAVDTLLDRLAGLQDLPVAQHGEVYAGLHDDLLAALNETVTSTPPGDAANEQA